MARSESQKWPERYFGIKTTPPLVLCATHNRWEGYDETVPGLCDYCCLTAPCPLGHDETGLRGFDEHTVTLPTVREGRGRVRHRTGAVEELDDSLEIPYLDWS